MKRIIVLFIYLFASQLFAEEGDYNPMRLWYDQPAKDWETQALPIGNGELGGMVFGGIAKEHIQFNVDSLWTGDENPKGVYENPRQVKKTGVEHMGNYQSFGDLFIDFAPGEGSDYQRDLDLKTAIATVSFERDGVTYKREMFCSHPDKVMVIRLTASKPRSLTGRIRLVDSRPNRGKIEGKQILFKGTLSNGMLYETRLMMIKDGGNLQLKAGNLIFKKANSVTLFLVAETNYKMDRDSNWRGEDPSMKLKKRLKHLISKSYDEIKNAHIADYQRYFERVKFELDPVDEEIQEMPIDKRIARCREDKTATDLGLEMLLFQYGRYLLISSSRPGTLPANLQGIWNKSNTPPWHCDYHSNINLQMNYWLAETAGLPEMAQPYFDMLVAGVPVYREITVRKYGAVPGFVTRMSINPFGGSGWNWNIEGTAWLAQHFWEHYAFTQDKVFLQTTAWPWLRDVSQFWLKHLKKLPDGTLVAPNVWSHEHGPHEDGTAHSEQLMWDLFSNTIAAGKILKEDPAFLKKLEAARSKLYEPKVGSWGQLMEWMEEKPKLEKSHHRHTSHLFAVYPGHQISRWKTPKLAKAAALSLKTRGTVGDSRRSWTWPWRTALWARLGEAENAHNMIKGLIQYNLMDNMLTTHKPFQMDGNFGITAGITEMLLQSHEIDARTGNVVIELIPALPKAWKNGSVTGLRARGGLVIDMRWRAGKMVDAKIRSVNNTPTSFIIRLGRTRLNERLGKNQAWRFGK